MARTNAEWTALRTELIALANNPRETPERRRKAQDILDSITRPLASAYHPDGVRHHKPRPAYRTDRKPQTDYDYNTEGKIV